MKAVIRLLLLFLLAAACAQPGQAGELAPLRELMGKKWPANRAVRLVFHGHSVPAGYQVTPEVRPFEAYPHLVHVALKERFPHAVTNLIVTAIGGENSVQGEKRFAAEVLPLKPDLLFLDYALNDRKLPLPEVEAAWKSMIAQAKRAGIPVVLLTPTGDAKADLKNPRDPLWERADLIRRLAKDEAVLLADVTAGWQAELAKGTPQKELLSQPNHPNARGHRLAAEVIAKTLAAEGLIP